MDSSEKLIELGNSWYTAKTIEVERQLKWKSRNQRFRRRFILQLIAFFLMHSEGTALEENSKLEISDKKSKDY